MKVANINIRNELKNISEKIIQLNQEVVKGELKELVRKSVEETLYELLDKEADELTVAGKYERTVARQGYRSGHYSLKLTTTSGEVRLEVPKLKWDNLSTFLFAKNIIPYLVVTI